MNDTSRRKKLQAMLCPGVELPPIKLVTKETITRKTCPYTEWRTFSCDETVEIDSQTICRVPFFSALCGVFSSTSTERVYYHAPVDWEILRLEATVLDGHFKSAKILRTVFKGHKGLVELLVQYKDIESELAWCTVRLEGLLSKSRLVESNVVTSKQTLVLESEDGTYELPEELLDELNASL